MTALVPSFPCVTCPVQANMTTGTLPNEHGVVANGFYWRDKHEVEMWTAWNDCIQRPQIWDMLHQHDPAITSAVWFPLHSKGCGADLVCTPAPIHNPDGTESLWCYTKPTEMYGTLRDALGHFPLAAFLGTAGQHQDRPPGFATRRRGRRAAVAPELLLHLPAAPRLCRAEVRARQRRRPTARWCELDDVLAKLLAALDAAYAPQPPLWLVASEYTIVPVDHVTYPNRVLREAGLLAVDDEPDGEQLDLAQARRLGPGRPSVLARVRARAGRHRARGRRCSAAARASPRCWSVTSAKKYDLDHERAGEVVLVSTPNSWQAYYWWLDDARAPKFARTVDIHRKPGYDPVELHVDMATRSIPLDATLVKGSHGAPPRDERQRGVIVASEKGVLVGQALADTDVCELVLRQFGI